MRHAHTVAKPQRRAFLRAMASAFALLAAPPALGRPPILKGTEMDAIALEFVADATHLHPSLQPLYVSGSRCAKCFFYQGRRDDESAACTVFAGYRVPATGWCREFTKRK